jgi:hypothetical protein
MSEATPALRREARLVCRPSIRPLFMILPPEATEFLGIRDTREP